MPTKKERIQRSRKKEALLLFADLLSDDQRAEAGLIDLSETNDAKAEALMKGKYADDFDIVKLMNDAEDPDTGLIRDLKIDDRDLASAKNYWDFSYNILGKDSKPPWMIQMWIGVLLFAEVCPCCSDKRWFDLSYIVEKVGKGTSSRELPNHMQLLNNGVCPKCKRHKYELIKDFGLRNYQELVNVLGQRSGKSSSAAAGYAPYMVHRYLKFPRLATMTNSMQNSTELTGTFVSVTFSKAASVLWTPFVNVIDASRWFNQYHEMLDFYGQKYGTELYRQKDIYLRYFHKGLKFYPTHPNGNILRGDTRIFGIIDELGLFPLPKGDEDEDEQSVKANADEAHKSLANSLATAAGAREVLLKQGYNPPPVMLMGVSSPMSLRDKVMRLLAESRTPLGSVRTLGVNLPTWDVNPFLDRDNPIISAAYARNPEKAERDFGANPPRVHSAFIPKHVVRYELFNQIQSHTLEYQYDHPGMLYAKSQQVRSVPWPSIVTVDAGSVNNSFCITAGHFNFDTNKTEVSTMLECMPHEGRRIDFNLLYQYVILPVCRETNAVALLADQWQSLDILHRATADLGNFPDGKPMCLAKQYSPRRKDFDTYLAMMENENLLFPTLPRVQYDAVMRGEVQEYKTLNGKALQHFVLQLTTIKDLGPSKCPTKGDGFTDDMVRASVLITKIHEPRVMSRLVEARKFGIGKKTSNPLPVVVGRSGIPGFLRR